METGVVISSKIKYCFKSKNENNSRKNRENRRLK